MIVPTVLDMIPGVDSTGLERTSIGAAIQRFQPQRQL